MIRRRLLLFVPASLVVLAACIWYWLLHTESGAGWIWARAQSATNDALQAQQLQGDLGSGLMIRRLAFATDSMSFEIEELRLSIDLDLLPLQLQISEVVFDTTKIQISAAKSVAQNKDLRSLIENLALPLSLVFTDISADKITVSGLMPENDILLTQATLAGSWRDEISIDHLQLNSLGSSVAIDGAFGLTRPFATTVSAQVTNVSVPAGVYEPVDLNLHAEGNLEELSIRVSSAPIAMSVQGSLANILESLSWDLQAELLATALHFGENGTEVRVTDGRAISSGTMSEYSLTVAATLDTLDFEPLQMTTIGNGTAVSFEFSEFSLRGAKVDLSGNGRIAWGDNWSIESRLGVAAFDLGAVLEDWPAEHPIRGELSLLLDENQLAVSDSYLTAGETGMSVQVEGKVDFVASIVAGAMRWENAEWPLIGNDPAISSKSGNISVDGTVDDWRINGNIEVGTATMPVGRLRVDGNGDRHHLAATIIESEVLGGTVSGYAAFNWRDRRTWFAGLEMSGIGFGSFADDWPNDVTGRVDADGQMLPFLLDLRLSGVDAEFLGGPLSANGQVTFTDEYFAASDLKILHGDTRIELDGDPYARSGLQFDVALSDAARYLDEANGNFAAAGSVSLHSEQPSIRIDADSDAFSFRDMVVTGIEINDRSGDDSIVNTEIKAGQLDIQGKVFKNVTVSLLANASAQSLRLNASYGDTSVDLFAAGKLDDLQNPSSWQGELRELNLVLEDEPLAELSEPVRLLLSKNTVTIDRGCIAGTAATRLCAQADWSADSYFKVDADLLDVPVNLVNRFVDTGLNFDQLLNGKLEWSQHRDSGTTGRAEITMSAGTVVDGDDPDITIKTDIGLLSFDVVDGRLLSGSAELSMPGFGHIDVQLSIPDFAQGTGSSVNGLLDVDLSDMAVLAAFSPLIGAASGDFNADLTLSGTLSKPLLVGDLAVINGSMTYLPIGLQLKEINLTSQLHDDGQFELSGEFLAGEGRGEILTRADYATTGAKGFELELRGNNMTLIDVPNITARANLDVRIGYDYKVLTLDGQIIIPHARAKPTNLTITRDTESEDVVIVAGELPDDNRPQSSEQEAWIKGAIGVELGDDVSIDLGSAIATLSGKTVFSWEEDLVPIADGRYDLTGSVQAFGQVLEITEGGLRFPKIPADNPFIRIRAEREIYGNVQVKTAGVLVDGTLKRPSISAYTRPLTTEERALTLLVTGSDFDFEQGLGAIDFGTYISPRVFVSYGVGLFETENVIRVRYDIKRGFGITATSGEKEAGLDLSYRIER